MYKPGTKDTDYCHYEDSKIKVKNVIKLSSLRPSFLIICVMILNGVYQRFWCIDVSMKDQCGSYVLNDRSCMFSVKKKNKNFVPSAFLQLYIANSLRADCKVSINKLWTRPTLEYYV